MRIRAVQFAPRLGDWEANLDFHLQQIRAAEEQGIDLLVFPELSLTGYDLQDMATDLALTPGHPAWMALADASHKVALLVGAPCEEEPGIVYNSALFFSGGKVLHRHDKVQLPNFGMFREAMIFRPGHHLQAFDWQGHRVGVLICREMLFPIHAYLHYLQGVDLLLVISNSPFRGIGPNGFGSLAMWEEAGSSFARFHHQNTLFVNRTGFEDGLGFGGGSFWAVAGRGIQQRAPHFEEALMDVTFRDAEHRLSRIRGNQFRDERPEWVLAEIKRILHAQD